MTAQEKQKVLEAMVLAPSAHNTQPWLFKPLEDGVSVYVDWSRHLEISDPATRQLYMSLGCAIENAVVAGEAQGYSASVAYFPEGEGNDKPAAHIAFSVGGNNKEAIDLFKAIPERRTNRAIYDGKPLSAQETSAAEQLAGENVLIVTDRDAISKLAELTSKGTFSTLARKDFKKELSQWVRSSMTKKQDGMTGDGMGLPAPVALFAPWLVKIMPIHRQEGPNDKKQMESSSAIIVITASRDVPQSWLEAGRMLEHVWLTATAAGLAGAVHASAIESSEELRQQTREILGISQLPQTIIRVGHTGKRFRPAPRRTVEECLVRDKAIKS